jgi:hypothetical protein
MFTHQINHVLYMTGNNQNAAAMMQHKYCAFNIFKQYIIQGKLSKTKNIGYIEQRNSYY